jgi:hypothetical protein
MIKLTLGDSTQKTKSEHGQQKLQNEFGIMFIPKAFFTVYQ